MRIKQSVSTIGELEEALKAINAELKNVEFNSEAFETLAGQARALQKEIQASHRDGIVQDILNSNESLISNIRNKKYPMYGI